MKGVWLFLLLGFSIFAPSLFAGYPLDDEFVARALGDRGEARPLVGSMGSLGEYFTTHWWHGHYAATELFRPVTKLSFGLVHQLFGNVGPGPAFSQHAVNLAIYAWACALVFVVTSRLLDRSSAWVAGWVFAVHAVHSEAVCTLTGRAELFAFAFGLQALSLLLVEERRLRAARAGAAALLFFLAFCSKESALSWVPVACVLAFFARGRASALRSALAMLPGLVAFFALRANMIARLSAEVAPTSAFANPLVELSVFERMTDAVAILGFGVAKLVLPLGLSVDYGPSVFEVGRGLGNPVFWFTLVGALVLTAAAWRSRRVRPALAVALFAYLSFAFLTSNLAFPIGTIFGERLLFSPSFAFAFGVAAVASAVRKERRRSVFWIPLALWCACVSGLALMRAGHFESTGSIAIHDVKSCPQSANLHRLASDAYVAEGDRGAAIEALEASIEIDPRFASAWLNLASLVRAAGNRSRAEELLRAGLRAAHPAMRRERAMLHASLAKSLADRGATREAMREIDAAIEMDPTNDRFRRRRAELQGR